MADEKDNSEPEAPAPADTADTPGDADTSQAAEAKAKPPLRKRALKIGLFCLYVLILLEVGSRAWWALKQDVPFFCAPEDFYCDFYPEVRESGVLEAELGPDDGHYDVLMLGGSAMQLFHVSMCHRNRHFQDAVEPVVGRPVRAWNLARAALTTRDSVIKYERLGDLHFDLVIVYHGINDLRMNNVPPEKFEDDYTHAGWYVKVDRMMDYGGMLSAVTFPYTIEYAAIGILDSRSVNHYVPRHAPNPEWQQYAGEIRTARPFEANLRRIISLAGRRGQPVVLGTFAWHIPEGYSMEKLQAGELPYADSPEPSPIEIWGLVPHVAKGLRVHNGVTRRLGLADRGEHTVLVAPVAERAGDEPEQFIDVCHLSAPGKQAMLGALIETLRDNAGPLGLPDSP